MCVSPSFAGGVWKKTERNSLPYSFLSSLTRGKKYCCHPSAKKQTAEEGVKQRRRREGPLLLRRGRGSGERQRSDGDGHLGRHHLSPARPSSLSPREKLLRHSWHVCFRERKSSEQHISGMKSIFSSSSIPACCLLSSSSSPHLSPSTFSQVAF